jgi:WD40 repeat protein
VPDEQNMARRRLEDAIVASRALNVGIGLIDEFRSATSLFSHDVRNDDGVFSLRFSDELDRVAVGYGNGTIRLFSVTNGKQLKEYSARCSSTSEHVRRLSTDLPIMSMKWHPLATHRLYAACADGTLRQVDTTAHRLTLIDSKSAENELSSMDFSFDGKYFATVGKDAHIRIYDGERHTLVHTYTKRYTTSARSSTSSNRHDNDELTSTTGHCARLFACKFHSEHKTLLLTAGWDNVVKLWDLREKQALPDELIGPHICGEGIDTRANEIVTASWTRCNALQLWDLRTMHLLTTLNIANAANDNGEFMYSAQLCDNRTVLSVGSGTNACHVINIDSNDELTRLPLSRPIYALDSMLGGRVFAFGGLDRFSLAHMKAA